MVCEMENDYTEDMDIEVLHSMWPEDIGIDVGKKFNIEKPGKDQDMLEEIIMMESTIVDFKRLMELTNYTDKGSSQLSHLLKPLEYKQANALQLPREELDNLNKQRHEVELRKLQILEELCEKCGREKRGKEKRKLIKMVGGPWWRVLCSIGLPLGNDGLWISY
ncbi:hypothetical protein K1719_010925 [Acacia pycnantha]|nr:hypothetical protein K1719_010925 [Acacia pycnantha]